MLVMTYPLRYTAQAAMSRLRCLVPASPHRPGVTRTAAVCMTTRSIPAAVGIGIIATTCITTCVPAGSAG
jgi:hypothetical protein